MGILSIFKAKKEQTRVYDTLMVMNKIANALDCTYAKEIDPVSFTPRHCFYCNVCGKRFKVASVAAESFNDYSSLYDSYSDLISTLKFEKDRNVKMIKDGLEYISKIKGIGCDRNKVIFE